MLWEKDTPGFHRFILGGSRALTSALAASPAQPFWPLGQGKSGHTLGGARIRRPASRSSFLGAILPAAAAGGRAGGER